VETSTFCGRDWGLPEFPDVAYGRVHLVGRATQGLATGAELTRFEKASLAVGGAFLALWLLTLVLAIIVLVLAATG
jgi:hypothetical protein